MRKFSSKKEQLEWADKLLRKLSERNTGGVTPIIKKMSEIKKYDVLISYPIQVGAEDEDTIDGRFYRLINVNIPDLASGQERNDWGLYLEMINPSTGESHFEGIANVDANGRGWRNENIEEATVKAALSWRDGDGVISTGDTWKAKSTSANYVKPIILT